MVCKIIQMGVILGNSLSVSYFTFKDEYWSIYYVKPYARMPVFLIGVLAGCSYFTYKKEDPETQRIAKIIEAIAHSQSRALLSGVLGFLIMIVMVTFMQVINNFPNDVSTGTNLFYLLFSRPLFITGFSMLCLPIIANSHPFRPLKDFLSHSFWTPFSRLSYGAFLSHGIFMQFREYNTERGQWGCAFDAILFFFAYWSLSFLISFLMSVTVESPIAALWYEFAVKKADSQEDAFYHSQSAKSVYRDKNYSIAKEVIENKKKQMLEESDGKKKRKPSVDTEDLEEHENTAANNKIQNEQEEEAEEIVEKAQPNKKLFVYKQK